MERATGRQAVDQRPWSAGSCAGVSVVVPGGSVTFSGAASSVLNADLGRKSARWNVGSCGVVPSGGGRSTRTLSVSGR